MRRTKTRTSGQDVKASEAKPKKHKVPPDPGGLNKECAATGEKIVARYCKTAGVGRESALVDILHAFQHLCDRDPRLGSFAAAHVNAVYVYELGRWETEVFALGRHRPPARPKLMCAAYSAVAGSADHENSG